MKTKRMSKKERRMYKIGNRAYAAFVIGALISFASVFAGFWGLFISNQIMQSHSCRTMIVSSVVTAIIYFQYQKEIDFVLNED